MLVWKAAERIRKKGFFLVNSMTFYAVNQKCMNEIYLYERGVLRGFCNMIIGRFVFCLGMGRLYKYFMHTKKRRKSIEVKLLRAHRLSQISLFKGDFLGRNSTSKKRMFKSETNPIPIAYFFNVFFYWFFFFFTFYF